MLVQFLVEHQSTPDILIPERFLEYISLGWQEWRARGGRGARPPIIPVLIYRGPRKWRAPHSFAEGYDLPLTTSWRDDLLDFRIVVDDLTRETDERLRERVMSDAGRLALLALRHAHAHDLMDHLEKWRDMWDHVTTAPTGLMAFTDLVRYIADVNPHVDHERLMRLAPVHAEEARQIMPTLFQKERERGRKEGRREGLLVGQRDLLAELLRQRFGEIPEAITRSLNEADKPTIERWAKRLLTAHAIEDVLR